MEIRKLENLKLSDETGMYDLANRVPRKFVDLKLRGIVSIDKEFEHRLHAVAFEVYGSTDYVHMLYEVNAMTDLFYLPEGFLLVLPELGSYSTITAAAEAIENLPENKVEADSASSSSSNKASKPQIKFEKGRVTISSKRKRR